MKKPSTLAEQIRQAQREVNSWSPEVRATVQLEGNSSLLSRYVEPRQGANQANKASGKRK